MRVVPASTRGTVKASAALDHLCPFVDEVDKGSVDIAWECAGATIELHSLAAYLASWAIYEISHEELTERIWADLHELTGIRPVRVRSFWHTAGVRVEVLRESINADGA